MAVKEHLQQVLETLHDERLREVLDFAQFLRFREEHEEWQRLGQEQFALCYAPDEPEYPLDDLKPELNP